MPPLSICGEIGDNVISKQSKPKEALIREHVTHLAPIYDNKDSTLNYLDVDGYHDDDYDCIGYK